MSAKSIGFISEIVGNAQIRTAEGLIKVALVGDIVKEGDVVLTGQSSHVVVDFNSGEKLNIGAQSQATLDDTVSFDNGAFEIDRVDQQAALQQQILDTFDVSTLEETAAERASSGEDSNSLHQSSIYERSAAEGVVETRLTPIDNTSDVTSLPTFDTASENSAIATGDISITLDVNISTDDIINATEQGELITITGTLGSDVNPGDIVSLVINGVTTDGVVLPDNTFSIDVAGSDLAADVDATIEASVTSTNASGETITATDTESYSIDTTPPVAAISLDAAITADNIINAEESNATIPVSGSVTGEFQAGDLVTLTVNGVVITAPVAADGSFTINVQGSDLLADPSSSIDVSFVSTDVAGNESLPVTSSIVYSTDITASAIINVDNITADDIVNSAEANSIINVTGSVGGDASAGDTVSFTINNISYSGLVLGDRTFSIAVSGSDLAADTSFEATVTGADAAGNPFSASTISSHTINTVADAGTVSVDTIAGDDVISAAESGLATIAVAGIAVGGDIALGDTVTVTVNGTDYITSVGAGGVYAVDVATADLIADNSVSVAVESSDTAANIVISTASADITVDTIADAGMVVINTIAGDDIINASESGAATISVSGTATGGDIAIGDTVTVTVNGTDYITTVGTGGTYSVDVDTTDLIADNAVDVTVDSEDGAGNTVVSNVSSVISVDTSIPTVSINAIATDNNVDDVEDDSVVISGSTTGVEDGQTITVNVAGTDYTATVTGNAWTLPAIDMSGFADETNFNVTADVADAAGNDAAQATTSFNTTDTTIPTISFNAIATDNTVDDAEDDSVIVSGSTTGVEDGQTITVNVAGTDYTATVTGNAWTLPAIDMSGFADETNFNVTADVADAAGNDAVQATTSFNTTDTSIPTISFNAIATDNTVDDAEDDSVVVSGSTTGVEDGQTITVNVAGTDYTATVTGNAWALPAIDMSGFADETNFNVTADVADAAGNDAVQATTSFDTTDTTIPTISFNSIATDNTVDDAEDDSVVVSGTTTGVEDGQTITVNVAGTDYTATVTGNAWALPAIDMSVFNDGENFAVTADVADAAGNDAVQATTSFNTTDTSIPTISFNAIATDNTVDDAEDDSVIVSGSTTGVEDGQTITVNVAGTDYTATVTGNAWALPAIDMSAFNDGENFAVTADVADAAGNDAVQATTNFNTADTSIPTISFNAIATDNTVDDAEDDSVIVSGSTTGVEDGQTITVNVAGTDYTATVTGNAWSLPAIDMSGFADETNFNVTADVADAAGNDAVQATTSFNTTDTTIPTITFNAIATDNTVDDAEDDSVVVSGSTTGVEDGQTITVNVAGTDYTATVTGNAWALPAIDMSTFNDGENFAVTADVADAAGNDAVQATTNFNTTDTSIPTISFNAIATDNTVDDAEDDSVVVSGSTTGVEDGQTITVNVAGTDYTATVTGNAWTLPAIDMSGFADETNFNVTADVADAAGNDAVQASTSFDTTDTTIPTISFNAIATDNTVDDAEDDSVIVSGSTTGVEDGQTITVNVAGTDYTTTVTGNAWSLPAIDMSAFNDGENFAVTADVADAAGNDAVQATTSFNTTDTTIPTISFNAIATDNTVDDAEDDSVVVSGSTTGVEDGQTITVNVAGTDYTATVTGNAWTLPAIDMSGFADETNFNVTADVADAAGNDAVQATTSFNTTDTTIPTISFNAIATDNTVDDAEDDSVIVSGSTTGVEDGQTITVNVAGTDYTATVTGNAWALPAIDMSGFADEINFNVTADVADAAGNDAVQATTSFNTTDTTVPTISFNAIATDNTVDDAEDDSVVVSGSTTGVEDGQTITVNVAGTDYTATVTGNAWTLPAIDMSGFADETNFNVTADVADAAGNDAVQATTSFNTTDTTFPTISFNAIATDNTVDDAEDDSVIVSGSTTGVEDGQTITVNVAGTDYTATVTGNAWALPAIDMSGFADETNFNVTADVADAAGNDAVQASTSFNTTDTTIPTISFNAIATDNTVDDAEDDSVIVSGSTTGVEDGQTITVNVAGTDYTATVTGNAWTLPAIDMSGFADETNFNVTADVSDTAGNDAVQATTNFNTTDTTIPTITFNAIATDNTVDDAEDDSVVVSGSTTGVEDGQTITVNVAGTDYTATVTGNAWALPAIDMSAFNDGENFAATADVADAAGNDAVQATTSFNTTDTTIPTISFNAIATDNTVDDAEDDSVIVSGSTTGVEDGQTITVNVAGTDYTATVTGNAWALPAIDMSGFADETNFNVTADVADAAGNDAVQATTSFNTTDTTVPTISFNAIATDNTVDDAEDDSVVVSGSTTGVEDGQTITVNVAGTDYTTTVTGNSWTLPAIDMSAFNDGENFAVTADVADAAGNDAVQATTSFNTTDTTIPTISFNAIATDNTVDDAEDDSVIVSGSTTGVEDGQTITVNVAGTDYTATVTGNAWALPAIDMSAFNDGENFAVTADVADAAGNDAVQATTSFNTTDTSIPTISFNAIATDNTVDDAEDDSVIVSGSTTGVEDGQTITVNVAGTDYTATVTGNAWALPAIDMSAFNDGENFAVTADVADAAGNDAVQATTSFNTTDTSIPTISFNAIATDNTVDDAEDDSVIVSGSTTGVEDGQTITVNVAGTDYTATVTGNAWTLPAIDMSAFNDGENFAVTADVADAAGNDAVQATTSFNTTDTSIPTISFNAIATDNTVDDAEDDSVVVSGSTTGVEDGQTITVNVAGTDYTATVTGNAWALPAIDMSAFNDGENFAVTADVADAAGNDAVQATTSFNTTDTSIPTISFNAIATDNTVDDAEDDSVIVSGSTTGVEDGQTITVNVAGTDYTATVTGNAWALPAIDMSAFNDGENFAVTADVADAAGNDAVQATTSFNTTDTTIPTISFNAIATDNTVDDAEDDSVVVSGSTTGVEDGQTITVNVAGTDYTATVTGNAWALPSIDMSVFNDGENFAVTADVVDAAGNDAVQASTSFNTTDTTIPTISFNAIATDNTVDDAEDDSVVVSGSTTGVEDGQTITVNVAGTDYTATVTGNAWTLPAIDMSGFADETNFNVTADVADAAGNDAIQATTNFNTTDTSIPTISFNAIASDNTVDDAEDDSVVVSGSTTGVEDGQTITVNVAGTDYTATVTGNAWTLPAIDMSGFADETNFNVTADVADAAGNDAVQAITSFNTTDTTIPTISFNAIATDNTVDDAEDDSVIVSGSTTGVEDGQTITVNVAGTDYTATVTGNAWTLPAIDMSGFADETNFNVTADVADAAGNDAIQATTNFNTTDTSIPTISFNAIAADNTVDDAEDDSVVVSGSTTGVEDGQTITVNVAGTDYTATVTGNAWALPAIDMSAFNDGENFAVTADVADAAGNDAVQATTSFNTTDTTIPTISFNAIATDNTVDDAEDDSVVVSGSTTGVEDGQTITVNVAGTDYTATVTGNAWTLPAIDMSGFADETNFNVTADVADAAGNDAVQATTSFNTTDTTFPTISFNAIATDNTVDDAEDDSVIVSGSTTGVEDGQTITVNVAGTDYTATVTGNAWALPAIDMSGFADETNFNVTADVADAAGNDAVQASTSFNTTDTTIPTISFNAIATDNTVDDAEDDSVIVSGSTTGVEDGQTITVNVAGTDYTATITGNAWTLPAIDMSGFADETNFNVTADVADAAGNDAIQATTSFNTTDTTVPTISFNAIATDNTVDDAEDDSVVVSGSTTGVEDGQTITVNVAGTDYTATVTGNAWTLPAIDMSGFADETNFNVTADVADAAGNDAVQATTNFNTTDTTIPTISFNAIATDNTVDDAEDDSVIVSGSTTGVEDGQTITVNVAGADYTATVTGNAWTLPAIDMSGFADETNFNVTADVADAAGNDAVQATTSFNTTDTTIPTISFNAIATDNTVDDAEDDSVVVSGSTTGVEDGQTITVNVAGTDYTATVTGNAWALPAIDMSGFADETNFNVTADVADAAGNDAVQATTSFNTTDTTIPTISFNAIATDNTVDDAEDDSVVVSGSTTGVEDGQTITVNVAGTDYTATVTGNTWTLPAIDMSGFADETNFNVTADVADAAGNDAVQATTSFNTTDTTIPTISFNAIATDNTVDDAEDDSVVVSGSTTGVEDGQTITVNVAGTDYTATVTGNAWTLPAIDMSGFADETNFNVTADVADAAGNDAVQATTSFNTTDTTIPTISFNAIATDNTVDDAEDDSVIVSGSTTGVEDGQTITVNVAGTDYTATVTGNAWALPAIDMSGFADETNFNVTADVADAAGNDAVQASTSFNTTDTTIPTISFNAIATDNTVDDAEDDSVVVSGSTTGVEDGQTITVNVAGTDYTATVTGNAWALPAIDMSGFADETNFNVTADVADAAGNDAVQATTTFNTTDTTIPTISFNAIATDNTVDDAEDDSVIVSGSTTGVEDGQTITVNVAGTDYTATVTGNAWTLPAIDMSGFADETNFNVTADVADAAGNDAVQATTSFNTTDTTIPTISFNAIATDNTVDDAEDDSVVVSGSTTGVEDGQTITVNVAGTDYTATVTGNAWTLPAIDMSGFADETNFNVTADVADAAGNDAVQATTSFNTTDTTIPTISFNAIATDNTVDDAEDDSVVVSGSTTGVEDGQTITVNVAGTDYTATVTGNVWTLPAIDMSGFADETNFNVTADVADAAGNDAVQASTSFNTTDTTIPTISFNAIATDNTVDDAEDDSVVVSGNTTGVEDGQTITVNVAGTDYTTTVTGNSWTLPAIDMSAFNDGENFAVIADVADAAGNDAVQATTSFNTIDTSIPTISFNAIATDNTVDDAEDDSVIVSGSTTGVEDGQTITVNVAGTDYTATVTGNAWTLPAIDMSAFNDGENFAVIADVADAAGNDAVQATTSFDTTDTTIPTISFNAIATDNTVDDAEDDSVIVSGSTTGVEDGQNITVNVAGTDYTATVTGNAWALPAIDMSGFADETNFNVTADVADAAGNDAVQATTSFNTTDTTIPTISFNAIATDNTVDDAEDDSVVVSGSTTGVEDGQTITVNVAGTDYTATVTGNAWTLPAIDMSGFADETNFNVTADVADVAGNDAVQATTNFNTTDTTIPTISFNAIASDNTVDDAEDDSVIVSGSTTGVEDGQTITVNVAGADYTATVTGNAWTLQAIDMSGFADETNFNVTADVADAAGNDAVQATTSFNTTDTTIPTISFNAIATDNTVDDAEDDSVIVSGSTTGVEDGQTITVNVAGTDYTATVTGNAWALPAIDMSGFADETNFNVTADVADAAGNDAVQATTNFNTTDTTIPTISFNAIASDNTVDDAEDDSVIVSGSTTGVEDGQTITVNVAGTDYTATVTGNAWTLPAIDMSGFADETNFNVTADVTDAAGNDAIQATTSFDTADTTIPTISFNAIATDNTVDDAEDDSVVVSGTTTGVEDGQTITVNVAGTDYTATVTGNAWALPAIDMSGFADETNFNVTADVTDAAGNDAIQATTNFNTADTTTFASISVDSITDDDIINSIEAGQTIAVTGTVGGDANEGDTISFTINSTPYTGLVLAGGVFSINVSGSDLAAQNSFVATVTGSDDAGNNFSATDTSTHTIDTTSNASITVDNITDDDIINAVESGQTIAVTGSVGGDASEGDSVSFTINSTPYSGLVLAGGTFSINVLGADLAADSSFVATVSGADSVGNSFIATDTSTHTVDLIADPGTININTIAGDNVVNATEAGSVSIAVSGTATGGDISAGDLVTVTVNGNDYTTTVGAGGVFTVDVDTADLLSDLSIDVNVDSTDSLGNTAVSTGNATVTLDTTADPGTVTVNTVAGDDIINASESGLATTEVSGTATGGDISIGDTVTVVVNGTDYITTVGVGGAYTVNVDTSDLLADNSIDVSVDSSDLYGNTVTSVGATSVTVDTDLPTISINTISGDSIVTDIEDNAVIISGTTTDVEDGQTVTVNVSGTDYTTTVTGNTWTLPAIDMSGLADGATFNVTADVTDVIGNVAPQAASSFSTIDTTAPTISIDAIATDDVVDDLEDGAVLLSGTTSGAEENQTVSVQILDAGGDVVYSGTAQVLADGSWNIANVDLSGLPNGAVYSVSADVSDLAGNSAAQALRGFDNIASASDDVAVVHESALSGGSGMSESLFDANDEISQNSNQGVDVATGNLLSNDTGASSIVSIDGFTQDGDGNITVTGSYGELVVDASTGDYTYTLTGAVDNSAAADDDSVLENFTYTNNLLATSNLDITIVDDAPLAQSSSAEVSQSDMSSFNLMFMLDVSTSMTNASFGGVVYLPDGTTDTRLNIAKQSLIALGDEYFKQSTDVEIKVGVFADGSYILNSGMAYTDFSSFETAVNAITDSDGDSGVAGGTNYESALDAMEDNFDVDPTGANISYFLSDGEISRGSTDLANDTEWVDFANTNNIESFAAGIGTGISDFSDLNYIHNVDGDGNGTVDNALLVPDLTQLDNVLLATVPESYGGSVVSSDISSAVFGADGGFVQTMTILLDTDSNSSTPDQAVTFTFDPAANSGSGQISNDAGLASVTGAVLTLDSTIGFAQGSIIFDFSDGDYNYFVGIGVNEGDDFSFDYRLADSDGDLSSTETLTITIVDGVPQANDDLHTINLNDASATGNVISGVGTDGGVSLSSSFTNFSSQGDGVDVVIDNAVVTEIDYRGDVLSLTTDVLTAQTATAGDGSSYTYTVSGGELNLTNDTDGSTLEFHSSGFYEYTPANAPVAQTGTTVVEDFTDGATGNGINLTAMLDTTLTFNGSNGVGISGGTGRYGDSVDGGELLEIAFDPAVYEYGVQNVLFDFRYSSNSGTLRIYDIDGSEIGAIALTGDDTQRVPLDYTNIGKITLQAGSAGDYSIQDLSFDPIELDTSSTAAEQELIGYTLTDEDGSSSSAVLTVNTVQNNIAGTVNADTLSGTSLNDRIVGLEGGDNISGGQGNDILEGGDGADTLFGQAGNDLLSGGSGIDSLSGGIGDDVLTGGDDNDTLYGGDDNDSLSGDAGSDTLFGDAGDDSLMGGDGIDFLYGGEGNDSLEGGAGSDTFVWQSGDNGTVLNPTLDTISDFSTGIDGDKLDLSNLLQGEESGSLTEFLHFASDGDGGTTVSVDVDGGGSFETSQQINLENVDLTAGGTLSDQDIINNLLANENIILD